MDAERRILWWSPGAEKIFGRSAGHMVVRTPTDLFTPEDVGKGIPDQEFEMALRAGNAEDDRWQVRADGSRFWASGILLPLRAPDGSCAGFAKILRNRTDLKEQLDALQNQIGALAQQDQQKNAFIATFSHELRNPLAALSNAVELLRVCAAKDGESNYAIDVIEKQVEFISRMIEDLLELTRKNTGKLRLNIRPIALQEAIDAAVTATGSLAKDRSQTLEVILPAAPVILEADPDRLQQVLVNLIANAVKFTPKDGLICVKGTMEGNEAIIIVEDNGAGIPPDMLSRIFDLFTQVETPGAQGGLGIGLAVVKELVAAHGGTVQVRSDGPGKGSEFTVRLPLKAPEAAPSPGAR
jgi:two-component system CheB/CheR fusion protein